MLGMQFPTPLESDGAMSSVLANEMRAESFPGGSFKSQCMISCVPSPSASVLDKVAGLPWVPGWAPSTANLSDHFVLAKQ